MSLSDLSFLNCINVALLECSEYDVLPHLNSEDHQIFYRVDGAFAICRCTVQSIFEKVAAQPLRSLDLSLLMYLLLISPNTVSFWNVRREALLDGRISPLIELTLTRLISRKYPRSNETIFHRQWIIEQNYSGDREMLKEELKFCSLVADSYRCHYAIWQYRRFLLDILGPEIYVDEIKTIGNWLNYHPTDISGWNYLGTVFDRLISRCGSSQDVHLDFNAKQLLVDQFQLMEDKLTLYPERESIWIFKRHILLLCERIDSAENMKKSFLMTVLHMDRSFSKTTKFRDFYIHQKFTPDTHPLDQFFTWCYENQLCNHPAELSWVERLELRHVNWLICSFPILLMD